MRTYGQYCPISRAAEILAERWTLLVVRNLFLGCSTFNEIARGLPGMSRSLLTQRLRMLEDEGVVRTSAKVQGHGKVYELTEMGVGLWGVIEALQLWGKRWLELNERHTNPSFVLWAWVHVHLRREKLPKRRRVVVRFDFPDETTKHRRLWILVERQQAELCFTSPGFDADLHVTARSEAFTRWHVGELEWRDALRAGDIAVEGPKHLARALPTWNDRKASS